MKQLLYIVFFTIAVIFLVAGPAAGAEIKPGDSTQAVLATLGEPRGYLRAEDYQLLYYDRGKVEIRDGVVVTAKLVSEEEARALRVRRQREEAARRAAAARRRRRLVIEGKQALTHLVTDPQFLSAPASEQVAVWRNFAKRYPYTPLPDHYHDALKRYEEALEEREQEQRIAALEERVREADRKAQEAEFEAQFATRPAYYPVPYFVSSCVTHPRRHVVRKDCRRRDTRSGLTVKFGWSSGRGTIHLGHRNFPHSYTTRAFSSRPRCDTFRTGFTNPSRLRTRPTFASVSVPAWP